MKLSLLVALSLMLVALLIGGCAELADEASEPQNVVPEQPAEQLPSESQGSPETVEPSYSPPIPSQPPPAPITELVGPPRVEGLVEPKPEYEALGYCNQYFPEGLRLLTDAEKERVIELALEAFKRELQKPHIQDRLKDEDITNYRVPSEVEWYGIEWSDVEHTESKTTVVYDYYLAQTGMLNCIPPEDMEFGNYAVLALSEEAVFYPGVTINVGTYHVEQMQVAIDLDEEKIVLKWGLYPSLSSPDRFEGWFSE